MIPNPKYHSWPAATCRDRRQLSNRSAGRGFTLIELLVAMSAGVLVALAAFLLARNATKFFQAEARISDAHFSNMIGFNRLKADLQRAGFMSSPNVQADPMVCGKNTNWPVGLTELAALRIEEGGSKVRHPGHHTLSTLNSLNPDAIIIAGTLGTTEYFSIQAIVPGTGGGSQIWLQNDAAMNRFVATSQDKVQALGYVFKTGRFLRVVDHEGRHSYGVITGVDGSGINASVTLAATPALPLRSATNSLCGCDAQCVGGVVSPIARILYDLRTVTHSWYTHTSQNTPAAAGVHKGATAALRTDLVRMELDQTGAEIPNSIELVAEFAVDLKFGITTSSVPVSPLFKPEITQYGIGDAATYTVANSLQANGTPQRIRSVRLRFSTRAARRDRDVGMTPPNGLPGIYRYKLGAGVGTGFARVRTLVADVDLPNLGSVAW